jgi:hypothetical protein
MTLIDSYRGGKKMNNDVVSEKEIMKAKADEAAHLYRIGKITREEALKDVQPYIDLVNEASIRIAKKYNMKPKKVYVSQFLR